MCGKAPSPSYEAPKELESEKREVKKSRAALFETSGGALGEEIQGEDIRRNQTLFGN